MKKYVALFAAALLLVLWAGAASAAGIGGVTPKAIPSSHISASVSMDVSCNRTWKWDIKKCVTPDTWNLFAGDEAVSTYTVTVTKTGSVDIASIAGAVNVSNNGNYDTADLAISLKVQADSGSGFADVCQTAVDTAAMPVLGINASYSYPYSIDLATIPNAVLTPGTTYKVIASVTVSNDIFEPGVTAEASKALQMTETNPVVHVTDSWSGAPNMPWTFSDSGSVTYDRTFAACDSGVVDNTATITETGQKSSARVTINRYSLCISKTASGAYSRKYVWTIDKTGDQTCLKIAPNQTVPVNYTVTVTATPSDACYKAGGVIAVKNPAPVDAVINSVSDLATGGIAGIIDTTGVTFPYALKAGATLSLPYTMTLPDASARTNTATAVQQNFRYKYSYANKTAIAAKTLTATAAIAFGQPTVIDGSATVTDDLFGTLGTVQATSSPAVFHYTLKLSLTSTCGGYTVTVSKSLPGILFHKCTDTSWKVTNTATLTTCTTHTVLKDSWTVTITKGTFVGTYTIGYWKNHTCELGKLLPICLGSSGGCKTVQVRTTTDAVKYLGMTEGSSSNGVVKLYAQLLAAKLNIKNGADPSAVSSVISSADAFLAKNDLNSWTGLSTANKNLVLSWASTLDNYNNGVIGPGHGN